MLRMDGPTAVEPSDLDPVAPICLGIAEPQAKLPGAICKNRPFSQGPHLFIYLVAQGHVPNFQCPGGVSGTHRPKGKSKKQKYNKRNHQKKQPSAFRHYTHRPCEKTSAVTNLTEKKAVLCREGRRSSGTTGPEKEKNRLAWLFPEALYHE